MKEIGLLHKDRHPTSVDNRFVKYLAECLRIKKFVMLILHKLDLVIKWLLPTYTSQ